MKSESRFLTIILLLCIHTLHAQTITLAFSGLNNGQFVPLEKIEVENLDKSCDTTLFYPDSTLVLHVLGINDPGGTPDGLVVFQNSPNPVKAATSIKIFNPATDKISIVVSDISGKQVCTFSEKLERGYHLFDFSPGKSGTFIVSVTSKGSTQSIKVTSNVMKENVISYIGYTGKINNDHMIKATSGGGFLFSYGDHLRYTGYYNSTTKVLEDTPQSNKSYTFTFGSSSFTCGQNLTINHLSSGGVAPVNKITTYATVTNIPGEPSKCWITSNLGSDHQATAADDTTEASSGWYWQFARKQGFKHDGINRTPGTNWIGSIYDNTDWLISNDPCNMELGKVWRIPTYSEWHNVDEAGGWTNRADVWNSALKLHAAGELTGNYGLLSSRGVYGFYWSMVQRSENSSWGFYFLNDYCNMNVNDKPYACSLRCLRDTCSNTPELPTTGNHIPSQTQIIWNWNPVPGAIGYKWNTTNDYFTATDLAPLTTKTETDLICYSSYTRYAWAYNACDFSMPLVLTAVTLACPSTCGQVMTVNHVAGDVAPVNKTTTYGTVTNIPGEPAKCWIISNLGSDHQAAAKDDSTEASAGWYWQFNRKQGFKHDGTNVTPSWTITSINENSDWLTANDPCNLELGSPWRLPTETEWTNVYHSGGWTNWYGPWVSGLKLHVAGYLQLSNGSLSYRGSTGDYWSSTHIVSWGGGALGISSGNSSFYSGSKAYGFSVRCLRDN
jgi:hypothetical protein